jgi:hypothetical protein
MASLFTTATLHASDFFNRMKPTKLTKTTTIRLQKILENALRMRLFQFSLKDKEKYWLNSLETNSITSWVQM